MTVFMLGKDESSINYLIGFGIFPLIGIISTPNIVKHAKNDTQKWKDIFYSKGNLNSTKETADYYRVNTPVSFEKKILLAVYKGQFLNVLVVIGIMLLVIGLCIHYVMREHGYTGNIISNLIELKAKKAIGGMFFLMIFFLAFGIPIIAYYVSNALKKIRVVRNHEYIAYHVIVQSVNSGRISIYDKNKHYSYKYCTCVGIKEKDVHLTPATLIFYRDMIFILYLAVNTESRSKGYGSYLLKWCLQKYRDKKIYLNIEEVREDVENFNILSNCREIDINEYKILDRVVAEILDEPISNIVEICS